MGPIRLAHNTLKDPTRNSFFLCISSLFLLISSCLSLSGELTFLPSRTAAKIHFAFCLNTQKEGQESLSVWRFPSEKTRQLQAADMEAGTLERIQSKGRSQRPVIWPFNICCRLADLCTAERERSAECWVLLFVCQNWKKKKKKSSTSLLSGRRKKKTHLSRRRYCVISSIVDLKVPDSPHPFLSLRFPLCLSKSPLRSGNVFTPQTEAGSLKNNNKKKSLLFPERGNYSFSPPGRERLRSLRRWKQLGRVVFFLFLLTKGEKRIFLISVRCSPRSSDRLCEWLLEGLLGWEMTTQELYLTCTGVADRWIGPSDGTLLILSPTTSIWPVIKERQG